MASNRWRTPSMNDIRVPTRTRMSIGVARCPTSTINCDFARTVSVNPALHSSCICRDRSKLCSVVVDHQVKGRCHLEGQYVECHGASAIGIHHVRSLYGHPEDVAVCAQGPGCFRVAPSVECLTPDLGKGTGERWREAYTPLTARCIGTRASVKWSLERSAGFSVPEATGTNARSRS
jgi:hypothetical protein